LVLVMNGNCLGWGEFEDHLPSECVLEQFNRWLELSELVSTMGLTEVEDEPIWVVHSSS
jgi:hypothetical protein